MVEDPANKGTLIAINPPAPIPFITWFFGAPTGVGATTTAPAVVAVVEAPDPPEAPEKYGDAKWVKIYTQQLAREVTADELLSTNTSVVPESAAQIEVAWDILQKSPTRGVNSKAKVRWRGRRMAAGRNLLAA